MQSIVDYYLLYSNRYVALFCRFYLQKYKRKNLYFFLLMSILIFITRVSEFLYVFI